MVELGTADGGTLFVFAALAHPAATIVSIDFPGGPYGGGYPRWKEPLYRSLAHDDQQIYVLRGDSGGNHANGCRRVGLRRDRHPTPSSDSVALNGRKLGGRGALRPDAEGREVHAVERVVDLAPHARGEEVLPHGIRERDEWRCVSREVIREPADGEVASSPR
jgi:hypothetical protein